VIDRALRARVVMAEACELGLSIDDLVAAAASLGLHRAPITVAEYLDTIAGTFSAGTAATYGTYWRLAIDRFGDRPLGEVSVDDCAAVVAEAACRAHQHRSASDGRSSSENCVSALRALFARAEQAGLIATNPAAAVRKPRRGRSRRRPLEHRELTELIDAIATTSRDPGPRFVVDPVPSRVRGPT
jgi:integrase/recombinase XerC